MPRTARARGFTLLELLVAVSILAILAIMAWRGLSALGTTRARLEPQSDAVRGLLTALGQMERDLAQVPTSAAVFALPAQPLRVSIVDGQPVLQVLRLAPSADGSAATAVQSIFYVVLDGTLERQTSAAQRFHSAASATRLERTVLLHDIDAWQIRVWREGSGWITPATDADAANTPGVEVVLRRHDGSSVRRVLAVG